jgi:hypothetical protein
MAPAIGSATKAERPARMPLPAFLKPEEAPAKASLGLHVWVVE